MSILKQLAVWVTALRRRVTADEFLHTRVRIIGYLTLFALLIALGLSVSLREALESVSFASIGYVFDSPFTAMSRAVHAILSRADAIMAILIASTAFGAIVSEIAIRPIRHVFDMQKRFISALAHELRTPLSILRMNNEIMRHDVVDPTISEFIEENIRDIDTIYEMLNNLLIFDRLTSSTTLRFESVDIPPLVAGVIAKCAELAEQKRITISLADMPVPPVLGNVTSMEQVFFNIIKNAILYTPDGGSVVITYTVRATNVAITITDTGVGIPEDELPHVFEPFYRTDTTGKIAGTGIGLAIVYEIMKLHNGTIELESTEGKGTSFTLSFPVYEEHRAQTNTLASRIHLNFDKRNS